MTIFILQPDKTHCRPFYVAQQLETAAWRLRFGEAYRTNGETETEARARMAEHRKYKVEIEAEVVEEVTE